MEFEDVLTNAKDGSIKLKLRKSKTDSTGTGRWLYLGADTQIALKDWVNDTSIKSGKLFRAIKATGKIRSSLNATQIGRIYKKLALTANINPNIIKNISGHSMRVGEAQDLILSGIPMPIIMNRGRWSKIDTLMRYLENA